MEHEIGISGDSNSFRGKLKGTRGTRKSMKSSLQEELLQARLKGKMPLDGRSSDVSPIRRMKLERRAYLTKRILERASRKAFREAAKSSMERMGYVVVAQDGWIIRLFQDGRIERIEEIEKIDIPFILD